jgi:nitrate/nitrite transporter NarK
MLTFYLICFGSFITFLLFNISDNEKIIIVFICKLTISGIFSIIYTYFLENYPTSIRAIGFGINTSFDNIGGAVFPIIIELLNEKDLFSLLAFLNAIQFILMLFMPETCGVELPETIKEIEDMEKERKKIYENKDFETFGY